MYSVLVNAVDNGPSTIQQYTFFFGAVATTIGALIAAYVAWKKLRPETNQIEITTADSLVEIAIKSSKLVEGQRDDLLEQVAALREEVAGLRRRLNENEDAMHDEHTRATNAEDRAATAERAVIELRSTLEEERNETRRREAAREEQANRQIEAERHARRLAEDREARHASEVRRLWAIVNALREEIRQAGIPVPDRLLGGLGMQELDTTLPPQPSHNPNDDEDEVDGSGNS